MKPSKGMMRAMISAYYQAGNITGGSLHIVLDDGNTEDHHVQYCKEYAEEKNDADGFLIAELLLRFTEDERDSILSFCD